MEDAASHAAAADRLRWRLNGTTFGSRKEVMPIVLDCDQWIHPDAEDLAKTGPREAYERLLPELQKYLPQPAPARR